MSLTSVTILGAHPGHGYSMRRYTEELAAAYRALGVSVSVRTPPSRLSQLASTRGRWLKGVRYVENLVLFPALLKLFPPRTDLVHVADHSDAPWLLTMPRRTVTAVTCHDLIAVQAARGELPEHRPRLSGRIYQRLIHRGLARAHDAIAVSQVTANVFARLVPGVDVTVIHNPLPAVSGPDATTGSDNAAAAEPYYLLVSTAGWRKRRERSVEVWSRMNASTGRNDPLVIVGAPLTDVELSSLASRSIDLHNVTTQRDVPEDRLAHLYRGALGLISMSAYEGFGWPLIEAASRGTPVVCSDIPIYREVYPYAQFVADDLDVVDWARLTNRVLAHGNADDYRLLAVNYEPATFVESLGRWLATVSCDQSKP